MMLFKGLAAKIHCQSGFAPSTAGFYPTSAETSHSECLQEVTELLTRQQRTVTHRGILGNKKGDVGRDQSVLVLGSWNNRN